MSGLSATPSRIREAPVCCLHFRSDTRTTEFHCVFHEAQALKPDLTSCVMNLSWPPPYLNCVETNYWNVQIFLSLPLGAVIWPAAVSPDCRDMWWSACALRPVYPAAMKPGREESWGEGGWEQRFGGRRGGVWSGWRREVNAWRDSSNSPPLRSLCQQGARDQLTSHEGL